MSDYNKIEKSQIDATKNGGRTVKNLDIRLLVSDNDLKYKDIAKELHISREWLCRLMKTTLTTDNKIRILKAIDRLKKDGGGLY